MIAEPSKRLGAMPPYMFAQLEQRIAEKKAAGVDVISLGIGDPDEPTYPYIVEAMQQAVADPATHQYPSNKGTAAFRQAFAQFYDTRFGVEIGDGLAVRLTGWAEPVFAGEIAPELLERLATAK